MPKKYSAIGLMSGTSLDGLDIAHVELIEDMSQWSFKMKTATSVAYDGQWQKKLREAINLSPPEIEQLDHEYGSWLGEQAKHFIERNALEVDLLTSHGHTVFHEPAKGITRQIGDGQAIADRCGIKVVNDFRSLDVELGGQGAPLVPIGDRLLFSEYMACLNLGGIANISFDKTDKRIAYDIGMANLPLNYYARKLGQQYDKDGELAADGVVNEELLSKLDRLDFYKLSPPKSLGIEWFLKVMLPLVDSYELDPKDKLATLVRHEAGIIGQAIADIDKPGQVLITGGGSFNKHLVDSIAQYISQDQEIVLPDQQLIEFKEALIFALMGVLRIRNEVNCLRSVTGATRDSSSGKIYYPKAN